MSYFETKTHQINFGAYKLYSAPPDLLDLRRPTSNGREERKDGKEGQVRRKGR